MKLVRSQGLSKRFVKCFSSFPDVSSIPAAKVTALSNGIRVATEKSQGDTAAVGVWVDAGSRYETAENNGASHFLETLTFSALANDSSMSSQLNTFTSRESSVFYTTGAASEVSKDLERLAKTIQAPITEEAVESERGGIIRELQEQTVEDAVYDRLHETAYRGHPLHRSALGTPQNIETLTKNDLETFRRAHYTGRRIVIAGAGNVDHDALVTLSNSLFGDIPVEPPSDVPAPYKQPAHFTGSEIRIRFDSMPALHVGVGFATAGWNDPDRIPLLLAQELYGTWIRSLAYGAGNHHESGLISKMSSEWLGESYTTFHTQYSDTGLFGIYATFNERHVMQILEKCFLEFPRLFYHCTEDELEGARNRVKLKLLQDTTTNDKVLENLGFQVTACGRAIHIQEMIDRIDAVDPAAINAVAGRFFYDRDFALAAIGPTMEMIDYAWLRARTFWRRY